MKVWRGFDPSGCQLLETTKLAVEFSDVGSEWILEAVKNWLVTSTVRSYLYPVHRTPTDDPIYGEGIGKVRVDK